MSHRWFHAPDTGFSKSPYTHKIIQLVCMSGYNIVTVLMYRFCLHFMCVHVVALKEQILHKSINIISI